MRRLLIPALLALLSGCGADGPPRPVETGVDVSGQLRIGVAGTL